MSDWATLGPLNMSRAQGYRNGRTEEAERISEDILADTVIRETVPVKALQRIIEIVELNLESK